MTESTWIAWCPKHKRQVGLVPRLSGSSVYVHYIPGQACECPTEELHIIHHAGYRCTEPETKKEA